MCYQTEDICDVEFLEKLLCVEPRFVKIMNVHMFQLAKLHK
jgi:hypothetical protein